MLGLRVLLLAIPLVWPGSPVGTGQSEPDCDRLVLTNSEKEEFLRNAKLTRTRRIKKGVSQSTRATFSWRGVVHDAHVQSIDVWKDRFFGRRGTELNFRDSYRFNIAAYLLNRMLGLDMVPVCVQRKIKGKTAAVSWWIDDIVMDEQQRYAEGVEPPHGGDWARQIYCVRVFDALIYNTDRNQGNLLITKDWKLWMIDHTRAFRQYVRLPAENILLRCEAGLLQKLRELKEAEVSEVLGPYLSKSQIKALLQRRDLIVRHFNERIQALGEPSVLYVRLRVNGSEEEPCSE